MSLKLVSIFMILTLGNWAWSIQESASQSIDSISFENSHGEEREWNLLLGVGHLTEFQKSVDSESYKVGSHTALSYGIQKNKFQYVFSWYRAEEETFSGNIKVRNRRNSWILSAHFLARDWGSWTPMVGVGLGTYRDQVSTQFGNSSLNSRGENLWLTNFSGGLQFRFFKIIYSDLLIKIVKRETSKEIEWASHATLGFRL